MAPKFDPNEVKAAVMPGSCWGMEVRQSGGASACVRQLTTKLSWQDICRQMRKKSLAKEFKGTAKESGPSYRLRRLQEILGTCFAVGCTVDGQKPIALQEAIDNEEWELPTERRPGEVMAWRRQPKQDVGTFRQRHPDGPTS
eukprot:s371_g11.t2